MIDLSRFDGHTKGPWGVDCMGDIMQMTDGGDGWPLDFYADSVQICEFRDSVTEPDARLIAAAPELVEELRETRARLAALVRAVEKTPVAALTGTGVDELSALTKALVDAAQYVDAARGRD